MAVFAGLWGPEVFETPDRILLQNHPFAVYNAGTNVLASIFTDRTKATPAPNPSATDAFGNGSFYADPDLYELEVNDFRVTVAVPMDPEEDESGSVPPVTSVNTEIGDVILSAADVGADVAGAAAAAQAFAIQRANHTGSQSADTLSDGATNKAFLATERTKLAGIEALADVTDAANVSAAGAVMKTGDETVNGIKTFPSSPIVPTPTTDFQAATKKYVDDNIGGGGGGNVSNANAPAAGEFAKFTSPTLIEGRTLSETRSDLGLVIGVNVQAWSTELDDLAAIPATGFGLSLLSLLNASALQDQAGISAFVKTMLDDANAAAVLSTLGISAFVQTLLDDANSATARTTLGAAAAVTLIIPEAHTYSIAGGITTATVFPGFFIAEDPGLGQLALTKIRTKLSAGTATLKIRNNAVDLVTGISVTNAASTNDFTDQALNDLDLLDLVCTAAAGATDLTATLFFQRSIVLGS